jgi:hypothetical protein
LSAKNQSVFIMNIYFAHPLDSPHKMNNVIIREKIFINPLAPEFYFKF